MPRKLHVVVKVDETSIDATDRRDAVTLAEHAIKSGKKATIFIDGKPDDELNSKLSKIFETVPSDVIVNLRIASNDMSDLARKVSDLPVQEVLERIDILRSTLQEMYNSLDKAIGEKTDTVAFAS